MSELQCCNCKLQFIAGDWYKVRGIDGTIFCDGCYREILAELWQEKRVPPLTNYRKMI